MAKGNKKEILEKLGALKTNTPTKTRSPSFKRIPQQPRGKSIKKDTVVRDEPLGCNRLIMKNLSALNRISCLVIEETGKFQMAVIYKTMQICLHSMKTYLCYFTNPTDRWENHELVQPQTEAQEPTLEETNELP
jgi:hypothetical protein